MSSYLFVYASKIYNWELEWCTIPLSILVDTRGESARLQVSITIDLSFELFFSSHSHQQQFILIRSSIRYQIWHFDDLANIVLVPSTL